MQALEVLAHVAQHGESESARVYGPLATWYLAGALYWIGASGLRFVPCDEIRWSLFGISMAGYNVLASLGLAAASLWAALNITGAKRS